MHLCSEGDSGGSGDADAQQCIGVGVGGVAGDADGAPRAGREVRQGGCGVHHRSAPINAQRCAPPPRLSYYFRDIKQPNVKQKTKARESTTNLQLHNFAQVLLYVVCFLLCKLITGAVMTRIMKI